MPRMEDGWSWVRFQAQDEEKEILDNHCKLTGRTKTDILREYIRSLAPAAPANEWERLLPLGWKFEKNQYYGEYQDYPISLIPDTNRFVCIIGSNLICETAEMIEVATTNPLIAIAHAQELVDSWLEQAEAGE